MQDHTEQLSAERERFNEFAKTAEKEKNQAILDLEASFQDVVAKMKESADDTLNILSQKRDEASNLVRVIGNIGVTGNYQKTANEEKESADRWRLIAQGWMVLTAIAILIIVYGTVSAETFDWRMALFRLAVASILLVPAWYAGKESAKHRQAAYRNRQAELELASIDPYLERMPEDRRNELKGALTEKFFGNSLSEEKEGDTVSAGPLFEVVKTAMQNLTKK